MLDRTTRQKESIKRWLDNNGKGILECTTGYGKTFLSIMLIQSMLKSNPDAHVLISVPTEILKEQWDRQLIKYHLFNSCKVEIINTIIKKRYFVDLLIIDEIHTACSPTFIQIFSAVKYKYILGLTGTLERLDGRHKLLEKYCPVVDRVTVEEAIENNWLSDYREYKILLKVDLSEYWELNKKFNSYFSFFNYEFDTAMGCVTNIIKRRAYAKHMGVSYDQITAIAMDWLRCLKKRKDFVMKHPKKLEIAHKILEHRQDCKCITFSATIAEAEKIKYGYTLHSGKTKKKNRLTLEEFSSLPVGVLNTNKAADLGLDVPNLSVAIILSGTSASIQKNQRLGRILRKEGDKVSEVFSLIIAGTMEENWYSNSSIHSYITITEDQLDAVLNRQQIETRQRDTIKSIEYRF